jgi:hypothetical protein
MTKISQKFSIMLASLLLVLSLSFVAHPQKTEAATCYKSGSTTFSNYFITPSFYWPGGYMYLDQTAYANFDPSVVWETDLLNSSGTKVGVSENSIAANPVKTPYYNVRMVSSSYVVKSFSAGYYKLKFKVAGGSGTVHVTSYCIHK